MPREPGKDILGKSIALFKAAFGENFVPIGTGRVIEVPGY